MKLHMSGEDYLEAILVSQKEKSMIRSVDVTRHMEAPRPSVCHAVVTLKVGGFLIMDGDFFPHLIDVSREVVKQTYEKHCFFTRLLMEVSIGPKTTGRDACRIEYVISLANLQELAELYQKAHSNTESTENERRFDAETDPAD